MSVRLKSSFHNALYSKIQPVFDPMGPKHVGVRINYKVVFDGYVFIPYMTWVLFYFNFFILTFFFNLMPHPSLCAFSFHFYVFYTYCLDI